MRAIIFSLLIILQSCSMDGASSEIYLLPEGFKGKVNILFNRKGGAPERFEREARVYEIPADGLLLTQFTDEYGLTNRHYYYVDSNGKRKEIPIYNTTEEAKNKEVGIFNDGTAGVYGNSSDTNAIKYQEFYVSEPEMFDSFFTPEYKKQFDDRVRLLIE